MKLKILTIAVTLLGVPAIASAQMAAKTTTTTMQTKDTTEPAKPVVVVHHYHHHHHHHARATMMHKSTMTKSDASGTETTTKTNAMATPK